MPVHRLARAPGLVLSLILGLLAALSGAARAQVNAEVLRPRPLRAGWSASLDTSLALARGNIELLDLGAGGKVQHQTLHPAPPPPPGIESALPFVAQRGFLTASGRFAQQGGKTYISQAFVHGRWTAMWHPRVGSDVFGQYQYNQFLRLQARGVGGGGVRVEVVHRPLLLLWAGSGYLFEYNLINVLPGAADPPETYEHRFTNYVCARLALLRDQLLLQNTLYVQPRFDAFADLRLLYELEALVRVTEVVHLGLDLSVLYDSAPPTGVQPTDVRLLTTLRVSL